MKKYLPLLALSALSFSPPVNDYTLYQALANSLLVAELTVNDNSTHYHSPFNLKLKNLSNRNLQIKVENGTKLVPGDAQFQNFTTVKEAMIALAPSGHKKQSLRAMCMEASDRAPSEGTNYRFEGKVDEKMRGLTQLIESKGLYSYMAQDAVWALANGESAKSISGYHYNDGLPLIEYIAKLNGEEIPPAPAEGDYERNMRSTNRKVSVGGTFTFSSSYAMAVEIGLFNLSNTVVRELYNNKHTPPGEHKVSYAFDNTVYTDSAYSVKMIVDGEVFLERDFSFKPTDWR